MPKLLTPEQVAGELQVNKRTVYIWLRSGKLKGTKIGDLWRVDEQDLQAFIERGKRSE